MIDSTHKREYLIQQRKKRALVFANRKLRIEKVEKRKKMPSEKKINIELGLLALLKHRLPGQEIEYDTMAKVCGCSRSSLSLIGRRAYEKFKKACEERGMESWL